MKATIIVFSPSGHTLKVGIELKRILEKQADVKLYDITRNRTLLLSSSPEVEERIAGSDLLIIGAPVYAGHLESNMLNFITKLPYVQNQHSAAFVTYGGAHSSIALADAAKALHKAGRIVIAGLKVAAEHTLTRTFLNPLNAGKPSVDEMSIVDEFAKLLLSEKRDTDISQKFDYVSNEERMMFENKSQDDWHMAHRNVSIDKTLCLNCGKCIDVCPVCRISDNGNGGIEYDASITCILCGECYYNCPNNAVRFGYTATVEPRLKQAHPEQPANAIFA